MENDTEEPRQPRRNVSDSANATGGAQPTLQFGNTTMMTLRTPFISVCQHGTREQPRTVQRSDA